MSIYNPKNILDKQPVTITTTVMAGVNMAVAYDVINPTVKQLGATNTFLILLLALFLNNKTANKATLEEMSAEPVDPDEVAPLE